MEPLVVSQTALGKCNKLILSFVPEARLKADLVAKYRRGGFSTESAMLCAESDIKKWLRDAVNEIEREKGARDQAEAS